MMGVSGLLKLTELGVDMKLYLDMDEVVADWRGFAISYLRSPELAAGDWLPDQTWRRLKSAQRMFRDLELKAGAEELVSYCLNLYRTAKIEGLYFLTALPHNNDLPFAAYDKVLWAQYYFPGIPVFIGPYSEDKQQRCVPGDILIDDRRVNCDQWIAAGGVAHQYKTWELCKPWLDQQFKSTQ